MSIATVQGKEVPDRADKPKTPAVADDGTLIYTSVSQLQKADERAGGCLRAWYFRYVANLPDKPASKAQLIGTEGHSRWEHYFKTGQDVLTPLERMALERDFVPPFGTEGLLSEMSFAEMEKPLDADGVPMVGYIDVAHLPFHHLLDFKYKADPYKWMVQGPQLLDPHDSNGIQMIGYGTLFRRNTAGELADNELVTLSHVTFKTEGAPDVLRVDAAIQLGDIEAKWGEVCKVVPKMRAAALEKDGMAVKPNFDACSRYGGCAYMSRCHDTATRLLTGFKKAAQALDKKGEADYSNSSKEKPMGLMSMLKNASKIPVQNGVQQSKTTPAPVEGKATTPEFDRQLAERLAEDEVGAKKDRQQERLAEDEVGAKKDRQQERLAEPDLEALSKPKMAAPLGVTPPDAPKDDAPVEKKIIIERADLEPMPVPPVEAPKRGPGRPRKNTLPVPTSPTPPSPTAGPPATGSAASGISSGIAAPVGIHLYVGCIPLGLPTVSLLPYVEELNKLICESGQIPVVDLRASDNKSELGFGRWKGVLSSAVKLKMPAPGHYAVGMGDERLDVVVAALEGLLPAGSITKRVG